MLESKIQSHIELLLKRFPLLKQCADDIEKAYLILEECYEKDGKLLIAGNGGSAADSEHITGELMKSFKIPRPVPKEFAEKLNIAIDTGLQKKDAKKFEKKVEVIQKESKLNKITDKLKQLRTNQKSKSKKETND